MRHVRGIGHLLTHRAVTGGVADVVTGLLEAGDRLGVPSEVLAAAPEGSGRLTRSLPVPVLPVEGWPALRARLPELSAVVLHGVFAPAAQRVARQVLATPGAPPLLAFPHDAYDDGLFGAHRLRKEAWFHALERPTLRRTAGVLVTAPSHAGWLRSRGVHVPVVVRPPGLRPAALATAREVARRREGRRPGTDLLFLGRWDVEEKGLDVLFEALAALPEGTARLRLAGLPLGVEPAVEALLARFRAPVELVGRVDDIWAELARADLLVLPSRKEGFGLAALQALAAGVPVLLSDRAGLGEHVGPDEGIRLVAPEVAAVRDGLAGALRDLPALTDGARRFSAGRAASFSDDDLLRGLLELVPGAGR